ncbi:P-loop NTPase fold protein [Clostridium sp. VAP23]|uniref:KAP family P-loop NTPase fold protein n=1 Tax=Clostridium sp. VAP23 TaxID=2949981 RepID=UPI002079DA58|nr:P-loop NTPase fold protein [Clostridium sp. VAP23]
MKVVKCMWIDNASEVDMLSYKPFAELLYTIVNDERMNPLTIGLYGSWGAGKSTILKLTENIINSNQERSNKKIVSINLNSWMFEGYDDAKCALMESLLRAIEGDEKNFSEDCRDKIKNLFKRVNYLRVGATALKKGIPLALGIATGNPIPFMMNISSDIIDKFKTEDGVKEIYDCTTGIIDKYIKPKQDDDNTIVKNIRMFKEDFKTILEESNVDNLVVMIDDLDRCTPDKIIETLEAIKLFLSVSQTTFIIAVDERVIKYSIKKKYPQIEDNEVDISKDYIEKIIQIPVHIPELSEIDIINYMILLVSEMYLDKNTLNSLLNSLYEEEDFFGGSRITASKIFSLINIDELDENKISNKNNYIKLSNVIEKTSEVVAGVLNGNPRQAKRFLNTFLIRKKMGEIYYRKKDAINIEILAKLMVLEYIDVDLFRLLNKWHKKSDTEIVELKELIQLVEQEKDISEKYNNWNIHKIKKWLLSEPKEIYKEDLTKYFYLSRESLNEGINSVESLTKEEKEILKTILDCPKAKDKQEILKLKDINSESENKIIKIMVKMFKENKIKNIKIGIIYKEFEIWRSEILEHMKLYNKSDLNIKNLLFIQMLYNATPIEFEDIIKLWRSKKIIDEEKVKLIKGGK